MRVLHLVLLPQTFTNLLARQCPETRRINRRAIVDDAKALRVNLGSSYPASVQFFSSLEVGASSKLDSENSVTLIMIGPFQYTMTG